MAIERCLKKPFKDSLEDIKERMKEKRNKKWAKLGKTNQVIPIKSKIADNSSTQLRSFQANNHALALALEEERSKSREAQDIILHLKEEYQSLKFQVFALQRKLKLQQEKEQAETRIIVLKKIISKVVQDLVNAANILDPGNNVCTADFNTSQYVSEPEECTPSSVKNNGSMTLLRNFLSVEVNKGGKTEKEDSLSDSYEVSPVLTSQTYSGCEDHLNYGRSTLDEEKRHMSYFVPRNVSTRRRHLRSKTPNELSALDNGISKISADLCEEDKTLPKTCSDEYSEKCEEVSIIQENKHSINLNKVSDTQTESSTTSVSEQSNVNKADGSKTQKEKRKLETTKNVPRAQSKKRKSCNEQVASKEKVDASISSNDAYDFTCGETVHITPFRQNRQNDYVGDSDSAEDGDNDSDSAEDGEICSGKSPISQEDSDDSLYMPCLKSKSKKTQNSGTEVLPVCTRSQSKKTVCDQYNTNIEEIHKNIKTPESHLDKTASCESSEALQKHHHLNDITNVMSTSSQARNYHPVFSTTAKDTIHRRSRSTSNVSYKEPSLSGKLRRGDPFTDTSFLNSPIFKEQKGTKSKSLNKKLVSRYNEAFVGCL